MTTWKISLPNSETELPSEVLEAIKIAFKALKTIPLWNEFQIVHENILYRVRFLKHKFIGKRAYWTAHLIVTPVFAGQTNFGVQL